MVRLGGRYVKEKGKPARRLEGEAAVSYAAPAKKPAAPASEDKPAPKEAE